MFWKNTSPYLDSFDRIGNVIAAIQVLGVYQSHSILFDKLINILPGNDKKEGYWKEIFQDHPEFFGVDKAENSVHLIWRLAKKNNFHVDRHEILTDDEIKGLSATIRKAKLEKPPLESEEISTLIKTAIDMHTRAIELKKETRWMSSPLFSLLGVVLGAALTFAIKGN